MQDHDHDHDAGSGSRGTRAVDPVCGMTVEPESARAKGLHSFHQGADYFFCGKGCKLDFDEDPKRYLDPGYTPSM
jgi:Cu+-exporting ATPase